MTDPQLVLAERVQQALAAAFGPDHAGADPVIRPSQFADFQANVALPLAKRLGRPPREVAAEIAARLEPADVCAEVTVSGPGFINLTLRDDWIAGQARQLLGDPRLGIPVADPAEVIPLDYSHPNVAKQMHVGHLRTTVVGDALARVLELRGHRVIRQNHIGDWGTPFGMLIEHLLDVGPDSAEAALLRTDPNAFYRAARTSFDTDPDFADRARRRVVALHGGDRETLRLWRDLVDRSIGYFNHVYAVLRVTLTDADLAGESSYNAMLADVCEELERRGIAVISEGALCVFLEEFAGRDGKPVPLIIRKSDGGYTYATTDLAAIRHRVRDLHADRIVYVVGAPQALHLQMIFATARRAGWLGGRVEAVHAAIGNVLGADGKMLRTRSGEPVRLMELVEEAIERAEKVIEDRYDDPAKRAEIAEAVGVGAVKYADLSVSRDSEYVFDFDRMLALHGNTGPYLQYATARIRSIFRRGGTDPAAATGPIRIGVPVERALALRLLGVGAVVAEVDTTLEPHRLCGYLHDVATLFTAFYEECPVLKAEPEARESRLALAALTLRVLTQGLDLLGIPVPDRM